MKINANETLLIWIKSIVITSIMIWIFISFSKDVSQGIDERNNECISNCNTYGYEFVEFQHDPLLFRCICKDRTTGKGHIFQRTTEGNYYER